mmetsp:Transcript_34559/g.107357  ORF Transcript_34559/g.107357 Transcript_34559/m.107357 type:complete len:320 (-) Transcript_34559:148-1107(-)
MGPLAADGELRRKIEEYKAREDIYVAALIGEEAELTKLRQMAADVLSAYGDLSRAAVRGALAEPVQNMEVLMLRQKAHERDQQISRLGEELEANRFDQKLPSGQALMKKCKALLTENRELGQEIREERLAELSAAVLAEQRQNTLLLQKCREAKEFCMELSQENEKFQGDIAKVAGRLREAQKELEALRKERAEAKARRKKERDQQKKAKAETPAAPAPAPQGGVFEEARPAVVELAVASAPAAPEAPPAEEEEEAGRPRAEEVAPNPEEEAAEERKEKKKKRKSDGAEDVQPKDKKDKKRRHNDPRLQARGEGAALHD